MSVEISGEDRKKFLKTELSKANSFITDESIKKNKFTEMAESPFSFYRATAHLFFTDIGNGIIQIPKEWESSQNINIWIQGDSHIQNLGIFHNSEKTIKFDINDFDESYIAPFYWDLIRFCTSIYLLKGIVSEFKLSDSEAESLANSFLQEYQSTLSSVSGNDDELTRELTKKELSGFTEDLLHKAASESREDLLNKWTITSNGKRKFNFSLEEDFQRLSEEETAELNSGWPEYLKHISGITRTKPEGYFTILDCARRINSGLGSQGVIKYYVLIEGKTSSTEDNKILEVKQQKLPSLFESGKISIDEYNSRFKSHAHRALIALTTLLVSPDSFAGVLPGTNRSFLVREISPSKKSVHAKDFQNDDDLKNYLKYSATALALAHSRSDKDSSNSYISYDFEASALNAISAWPSFKSTIRKISEDYAERVRADFEIYHSLFQSGALLDSLLPV